MADINRCLALSLIIVIIISGLILVDLDPSARAQIGTLENGILFADTVWTQAGSPYYFTGPVAINQGVKLTIEPGTVINMNNTYLQVNGTLTAEGSSSSMIQFNGGLLHFTPVSVGWNDQSGVGCTLQYANLNLTSISASVAIKLDNDVLSGSVQVGDFSVISNSNISPAVTAGNFCKFINNQVNGSVTAGNSSTITNNIIEVGIDAGDGCNILSNTVVGGVVCSGNTSIISNNNIKGGPVTGGSITGNTISSLSSSYVNIEGRTTSPYFPNVYITGNVVSNNEINNGTIKATQTISNNVITSGTYINSFRVFGGWADYTENSPAITTIGSPTISGNIIIGGGTYTSAFIFSSSTSLVPAIDLTSGSGTATITNNTIFGNSGLAINGNCSLISNNTITGDINGSITAISNNAVHGALNLSNGTLTVSGNNVTESIFVGSYSWLVRGNTAKGITVTQGSGYILDNHVTGTYDGVGSGSNGTINGSGIGINVLSAATIGRNIVSNNTIGIMVSNCTGSILNNTIIYNGIGVVLNATSFATTIDFNNIQYNEQSVVLEDTTVNINGTYNWWGTTDPNVVSQTIYDYKNDFNLGNVTFIPILNSANSQAIPNLNLPSPNPSPTPSPSSSPSPSPTPSPSSTTSPGISPTPTPSPTSLASPTATTNPTSTQNPTPAPSDNQQSNSNFASWIVPVIVSAIIIIVIVAVLTYRKYNENK